MQLQPEHASSEKLGLRLVASGTTSRKGLQFGILKLNSGTFRRVSAKAAALYIWVSTIEQTTENQFPHLEATPLERGGWQVTGPDGRGARFNANGSFAGFLEQYLVRQMSPEMLWNRVRQCFETNDGSLPTVELQNLTSGEVADVYSSIRHGTHVVSRDATFWDAQAAVDRELDEVPNAALLVSTGQASPFHFAIEGASACEITIPCLGVHVFQDAIAFDYRMGAEWGGQQVFAFFFMAGAPPDNDTRRGPRS